MKAEALDIPEGDVIVIRGVKMEEELQDFAAELHEKHPKSLIVWLSEDTSFETMPVSHLQGILQDLINHAEAVAKEAQA